MLFRSLLKRARTYRNDLENAQNSLPHAAPLRDDERILIISPHPDDETLATGALICAARQRGLEVCVVFLSNGDGSGSAFLAQHWREGRRPSFQQLALARQNEARAALKILGVENDDIVFLGYPDGGLGAMRAANFRIAHPFRSRFTKTNRVPYANAFAPDSACAGENVVRDLAKIIATFRATRLYTTDIHDTHADHIAAFEFARAALQKVAQQPADSTSSTRTDKARTRFSTFLVHHHIWPAPHGLHRRAPLSPPAQLAHLEWTHFAVDNNTLTTKQRALECYASQLLWTPLYLRSFLRRTEMFREVEY